MRIITKLRASGEKESYFKQNHIIILPPDLKMPFGITHYVTQLNYYVKYLHWINNGIMDGFIDLFILYLKIVHPSIITHRI